MGWDSPTHIGTKPLRSSYGKSPHLLSHLSFLVRGGKRLGSMGRFWETSFQVESNRDQTKLHAKQHLMLTTSNLLCASYVTVH
eukprot:3198125-Amphidinium_carterae.1